jgi:hypothetical protein
MHAAVDEDSGMEPQVIEADWLRLRPFTSADIPWVYEVSLDPALRQFVQLPSPYRMEDAAFFVERLARDLGAPLRVGLGGRWWRRCATRRVDGSAGARGRRSGPGRAGVLGRRERWALPRPFRGGARRPGRRRV